MKIFTEKGVEVGQLIGRNILKLNVGKSVVTVTGSDFTAMYNEKDDELSVVCEDGKVNTEILPKEAQNVEQTGGNPTTTSQDESGQGKPNGSDDTSSGQGEGGGKPGEGKPDDTAGNGQPVTKPDENESKGENGEAGGGAVPPSSSTNGDGSGENSNPGEPSQRRSYTKL